MKKYKTRMLLIDGAPGKLLYKEIASFLDQDLDITVNINGINNYLELKNVFQNRIEYASFNKTKKIPLIEEITRNDLGYNIIKLRMGPKINEEVIAIATSNKLEYRLKIIAQTGVGISHIDCNAATKHKVFVTNTPFMNSNAVAEMVIAQMLTLARNLTYHTCEGNAGRWSQKIAELNHFELKGKTLGIIGVGNIAKSLIIKASALGMKIITYSISSIAKKNEKLPYKRIDSLEKFLMSCDFVSIHTLLTETTKNLISTNELRAMKKGSFLINTARGGIVNEEALANELRKKNRRIAGAAVDVHVNEHLEYSSPLIGLNNVMLTPHIGGTTTEALLASSKLLASNIKAILNGNYNVAIVNKELIGSIDSIV